MASLADPARAERVLELVGEALDLPPGERATFLQTRCGDDAALRQEVDSLLGYQQTDTRFLERPAFVIDPATLQDTLHGELRPGDVLGDCRIESLLGEGGMGEVYLAEDTALGRRVAVKLLKRHLGDEVSGRRFRHERRVLAGLTHPGIARLYGAAVSPQGRSYLVMEYVEGERLDRYCDGHGLGVPERLALFRQVCAAVGHAHQNLVIHRDLKPANVRVTPAGEPKLLDFGIAKLLEPDPATESDGPPTLTLGDAMTPAYASPEQLRGEPITTASDVYSLGVILYELLTGQRPYQLKSRRPDEIARAICETEPPRPSTVAARATPDTATGPATHHDPPERLRRQLAGDLDNIVAMAMRKDPTRRYASVAQLSEDIRRHCDGLPVQARRDTLGYRTDKFVRRNKAGVAAGVLVVLALVAGLVATTLEARRADRRFEDVRRLAKSLLFELEPQIANLPGSTEARGTLVRRALEYLDGLSREAGNNRDLRRELAAAYEKIGDVQGNPTLSNLGDLKGALVSYRKGQDLLQSLVKSNPRDEASRHALADNQERLGDIFWWSDQTAQAEAEYHEALTLCRPLVAEQPRSLEYRQGYTSVLLSLGDVAAWNDQTPQAVGYFRQALPVLQSVAADSPGDGKAQVAVARCLTRIGVAQKDTGDYAAATATLAQAEGIVNPLVQRDPNNHAAKLEQWFITYNRCATFTEQQAFDRALALGPRMVGLSETLVREDPKNTSLQHNLSNSEQMYAEGLMLAGRWQDALAPLQRALEVDTQLAAASPENGEYAHSCGTFHMDLGQAKLHLGRLAEADSDEQTAQGLLEPASAKDPANLVLYRELAKVYTARGDIRLQQQQAAAAKEWFQRALAELDAVTRKSVVKTDASDLADLHKKLAALP